MAATADDTICGTNVKIAHIQNDICKKTGVKSALSKWSAVEIGAGKGFVSVMAKLTFEWTEQNEKLPKSAILKIPTIDKIKMMMPVDEHGHSEMVEAVKKDLYKIHNREISVYEAFGDSPPTAVPRIWSVQRLSEHGLDNKESAYILMQDLSDECTHWDLVSVEKLNWNQTEEVIRELAKVHSWSLTNAERCKQIEAMDMVGFIQKTAGDFDRSIISFKTAMKTKRWMDKLGEEALTQQDVFTSCNVAKYSEQMCTINLKHSIPKTLCHGDVHVNNMLFVKDSNGKPGDQLKALIDWQIVNIGSPLDDLCRLINWLGPVDRRSFVDREAMLQFYFEQFSASMKGANQPMPFTLGQLQTAFWETSVTLGRVLVVIFTGFVDQIEWSAVPGVDPVAGAERMMDDLVLMYKDIHNIKKQKQL